MEYTVKQFAELTGVTPRTLRYYDRIGLLCPARINASGYRIYSGAQADRMQDILFYRALDFRLEEIARLLERGGEPAGASVPPSGGAGSAPQSDGPPDRNRQKNHRTGERRKTIA
ncbi:MAG: MerR family transcriptional regulator [Clostridiales bacterium]|nr:MerR family transcriptional regulator [Clostridiales bacterium]